MPVTKDDVLAALGKVASPDGTPLPKTGTLSDIVAADGKVFFSISVDASVVQAWESVRKRAEEAVKAIPDVQSAMVALTAERKGGAGGSAPPAPRPAAHLHSAMPRLRAVARSQVPGPASRSAFPGVTSIIAGGFGGKGSVGNSTTAVQSCAGPARSWPQGRHIRRRRHLRAVDAQTPPPIKEKPKTAGEEHASSASRSSATA